MDLSPALHKRKFLPVRSVAHVTGYSAGHISSLCRTGKIAGIYSHGSWLVDLDSLQIFLGEQTGLKEERARELARTRAEEYRKHHQTAELPSELTMESPVMKRIVFSAPVSALVPVWDITHVSLRSHLLALTSAFAVVIMGANLASAEVLPRLTNQVATIAGEAASGFNETFGDLPSHITSKFNAIHVAMQENVSRVATANIVASAQLASPLLSGPDLSFLQMALGENDRSHVAQTSALGDEASKFASSTSAMHFVTRDDVQSSIVDTFHLLTSPAQVVATFTDAYVATGHDVYALINSSLTSYRSLIEQSGERMLAFAATTRDTLATTPRLISKMNLALGTAVIDATHTAIRAEVTLVYSPGVVAPEIARTTVALMSTVGAVLMRGTAATPNIAKMAFLRATEAPSHVAPALAGAIFDAEYAGASRFIAVTNSVTDRYALALKNLGEAGYTGAVVTRVLAKATGSFIAHAPIAIEDAYLGALGKTALALDTITRVPQVAAVLAATLPPLSIGEQVAIATYQTIHGFFDSMTSQLAFFFTPSPLAVVPTRVTPVTTSSPSRTSTPVQQTINSYPTYTTLVQGVSQDFVDQSLLAQRNDILARVFDMIKPLRDISNLIVRNGSFRGGNFDNGTLTNGISVSATTGNFDSLTAGDATISGTLSTNGSLSSNTTIAAPYFTATSTTATSTFAGSLNVDNGGLVYATSTRNVGIGVLSPAALLAIQNSTSTQPIFIASNAAGTEVYRITDTGFVGIGTTTPGYALAVEGSSSLGNQAIAGYFTATSSTATSTFAGSLAVGTTSPWGNGLFTVGTSTPLLHIDSNTGNVGIHSLASTYTLDLFGTLRATSDAFFNSNVSLGDATTTDITYFNSRIAGHLVPTVDNVSDIGDGTNWLRWRTGYFGTSVGIAGTATSTGVSLLASGAYLIDSASPLSLNTTNNQNVLFGTGNIGMGIAVPTYTLDVAGNAHFTSYVDASHFVATSTSATSTFMGGFTAGNNAAFAVNQASPANSLYVTSSGDVGVNTIAPLYKLDVNGTFRTVGDAFMNANTTIGGTLGVTGLTTLANASTTNLSVTNSLWVGGNATTTANGTITTNGNLVVRGTTNDIAGTLNLSGGALTATNALTITSGGAGDLTLDAGSGTINVASGDDLLATGANSNIGSAGIKFNTLYVDTVQATTLIGVVSGGSTNSADWTINSANATADTQNMNLIFERGTIVPNALLTWNAAPSAKRFEFNQPLFIQNASASTTLTSFEVKGVTSQTADLFKLTSSTGTNLLNFSAIGNLGIGNSSPSYSLDVTGTGHFTSYVDAANFVATSSGATSLFNGALTVNGNSLFSNATSTSFFATTASSTNLFSQTANVGTFAASGASSFGSTLGITGLATFQNGFISQASSTVAANFTTTGTNTFGGLLNLTGLGTFANGFVSQASSTIVGNHTVTGNGLFGGTLGVTGTSNLGALNAGNTILTNATSTNFFATTASSTNLFSQAANVGTFAVSGASTFGSTLGVTGLATFQNGFVSQASSTVIGNFTTTGTITSGLINGQTISSAANFTGTVNAVTGYKVNGAAAVGNVLRGDGTNFVSATLGGGDITGAALTKTDDTNITLTLGGTPATALLRAASLTIGWTGQLSVARGGTGVATFATNGVLYGNAATSILATAAGTSAQFLVANTSGVPTFVTMSSDATIAATGALTLATVNTTTGSFGSSTAIPTFTVNGKGLITAAGTAVVIAPAGTLSGTTLNGTVTASSLTSVGTLSSGAVPASLVTAGTFGTGNYSFGTGTLTVGAITSSGALALGSNTITSGLINGQTISSAANFTGTLTVAGVTTLSNLTASSAIYTDASKNLTSTVPTSGQLGYWTRSGTNLYNTNQGDNVGIGTTGPNTALEVASASSVVRIRATSGVGNGVLDLYSTNSNAAARNWSIAPAFGAYGDLAILQGTSLGSDPTGGTARLYISPTGNVGIGTTTPASILNLAWTGVVNDNNGLSVERIYNGGNGDTLGLKLKSDSGGNFHGALTYKYLNGAETETMSFLNNGNVGIGTTAPESKLSVTNGVNFGNAAFAQFGSTISGTGEVVLQFGRSAATSGAGIIQAVKEGVGAYALSLNPSGGNVGIGTTNPGGNINSGAYFKPDASGVNTDIYSANNEAVLNLISNQDAAGAHIGGLYFTRSAGASDAHKQIAAIETRQAGTGVGAGGDLYFFTKINDDAVGVDSARMVINNNGNVGIGTTTPGATLTAKGSGTGLVQIGQLSDSTSNGAIGFQSTLSVANYALLGVTGGGTAINAMAGQPISLDINNVEKMRIDNAGNVGIGTTAPGMLLDVGNNTYAASAIINVNAAAAQQTGINFQSAGTSKWYMYRPASSNDLRFWDGSDRITFQSGGNVGIGTTAPGAKLGVDQTNTTATQLLLSNNSNVTNNYQQIKFQYSQSNTAYGAAIRQIVPVGGVNGANLAFLTDNTSGVLTEAMRIDSSGSVSIGTTTPNLNTTLTVYAANAPTIAFISGRAGGLNYAFSTDHDAIGDFGLYQSASTGANPGAGTKRIYITANGNLSLQPTSGNVGIGTTNPGAKLDIQPASDGNVGISVGVAGTVSGVIDSPANLYINSNTATGNIIFGINRAGFSGGTEAMRIISNGNVGIGTTVPAQRFEVHDTAGGALWLRVRSDAPAVSEVLIGSDGTTGPDAGGLGIIKGGTADALAFQTNVSGIDTTQLYIKNNGNVGIGTTNPGQKLEVSGNIVTTASTGNVFKGSNFVSNQTGLLSNFGTTDGGFYFTTSGGIQFVNSISSTATNVMAITGGNVGIGTTNPLGTLAVSSPHSSALTYSGYNGSGKEGLLVNSYYDITGNNPGYTDLVAMRWSDNTYGGSQFRFFTQPVSTGDPVQRMVITNNGNVGIGTTAPGAGLEVVTNGTAMNALHLTSSGAYNVGPPDASVSFKVKYNAAGDYKIMSAIAGGKNNTTDGDTTGKIDFYTRSAADALAVRMTILNTGNVGIGTTGPGTKLSVAPATAYGAPTLGTASGAFSILGDVGTYGLYAGVSNTGNTWLQAMRNDSSATAYALLLNPSGGNVGIGTTNPASFKLQVAGNIGPDANTTYDIGSTALRYGCIWTSGGSTGTCASDVRLKQNIADLSFGSDPLGQMQGLRLRTFTYKNDPNNNETLGLIAQEVQQVAPELVTTSNDGYFAVKYGELQWLTVAAVQQLARQLQPLTGVLSIEPGVDSQCVTGDTRLRRRKRVSPSADIDDDFDEVAIKNIAVGDEIQSLDERSGRVVYSRVNALIDMGEQEVFELVTKSGRRIRTTSNHPFLARERATKP